MERLLNLSCNPESYSPLTLAFLGDTVYDLLVRERLLCQGNCGVKKLHTAAVEKVRCEAQARASEILEPLLTEEEAAVFRRGRNAHPGHTPKNANTGDYHRATALESLFGYLYLKGELMRIRELFEKIEEG